MKINTSFGWRLAGQPFNIVIDAARDLNQWTWTAAVVLNGRMVHHLAGTSRTDGQIEPDVRARLEDEMSRSGLFTPVE